MESPVEVRCRLIGLFPILLAAIIVAATVAFIAMLASGHIELLVPFGIGVPYWWFSGLYSTFYEVRLHADGELEFKAVLRTRRVNGREVVSVGPRFRGLDPQSLTLRTRDGDRIPVVRAMSNMFELATRLRELNPSIDLTRF